MALLAPPQLYQLASQPPNRPPHMDYNLFVEILTFILQKMTWMASQLVLFLYRQSNYLEEVRIFPEPKKLSLVRVTKRHTSPLEED